jgi:homopolymeric O-antigen transport system ATP-binding protein
MVRPIIEVNNLSKSYSIGKRESYGSLRDEIMQALASPFRKGSDSRGADSIWALKDVSFEVEEGEVLGIIGRNGAGKSTLLKILSRITEPTSGRITMRGRVASLLEVGTGFHPELTGRENIFLNGALLGMTSAEIRAKFDEIVAFSEIEKFLDTPVKRYSSGMYVRLAFAVAAHLEPEILVVDEVLAVGDASFQKKCLGKMGEVAKGGRTVLFVSHNMAAVQRLCKTGLYLESGGIKLKGEVAKVLHAYSDSGEIVREREIKEGEAKILKWQLLNSSTGHEYSCYSRDTCEFLFTVVAKRDVPNAYIGFALWNSEGKLVIASSSMDNDGEYTDLAGGGSYKIRIKVRLPLKEDSYQLDVSLNSVESGQLDRWSAEPKLNVLPRKNTALPDAWQGMLNEEVQFMVERE